MLADHTTAEDRRRETAGLLEDSNTARRVLELVRVADFGITDVQVENLDDGAFWGYMPGEKPS